MNRKALAAVAATVVLFGAAYIASPFWAARQFRKAATSADIDKVAAAVDFPAVRESLKSQMTVAITAKMTSDPEMRSNPFTGLGMAIMPAIIGRMVDSLVTPDGISALMKRGNLEKGGQAQTAPDVKYDYAYHGLDRFAVTVRTAKTAEDKAPKFVFERRGLFSWRMIRLEIPQSALAGRRS